MRLRTPNNFPIVLKHLGDVTPNILKAAEKGLRRGLELASTIARREFMSGPRPARLDAISGRLRGSIAYDVTRMDRGVIGRIGSNVKYARYHEFGFQGQQQVRAHVRHISDANWDDGGRGIRFLRDREGNVIGQKRESVASAQARGVVFVRQEVAAFTRHVNYPGKPFIKPALVKAQPLILREIEKELSNLTARPIA